MIKLEGMIVIVGVKKLVLNEQKLKESLERLDISQEQFFLGSFFVVQKLCENQEMISVVAEDELFVRDVSLNVSINKLAENLSIRKTKKNDFEFFLENPEDIMLEKEKSHLVLLIEKNNNDGFQVTYSYNESIYSSEQIEMLDHYYQTLMNDLLENNEKVIGELVIESPFESNTLIQIKDVLANRPRNFSKEVLLTPIQKYFFENDFPEPNHFNQGLMLQSTERVDLVTLKTALTALVEYHEILRVVFKGKRQSVLTMAIQDKYQFEVVDCLDLKSDSQEFKEIVEKENNQIQKRVNLNHGPLFHVALYQSKEVDYLLFTIHHLVVDAISWRVLLSDFVTAYQQVAKQEEISLPIKACSFYEWSKALKAYEKSQLMDKELPYWESVIEKMTENGLVASSLQEDTRQATTYLTLGEEETEYLEKYCNTDITEIILTALVHSVRKTMDKNKVSVQIESHGREKFLDELEVNRTVGWFTNIFPVVVEAKADLEESLVWTKEMLRQVPNNGIGYSVARFGDNGRLNPVEPNIIFNYSGRTIDRIPQSGQFIMSDLPVGQLVSSENIFFNELILNGSIVNEQLTFKIDYRTDTYSLEEIAEFIERLKEKISQLISLHLNKEEKIATTSNSNY